MSSSTETPVVEVDRFEGNLIISFKDNRRAVFSADVLYASLPQAQELFESELGLDDEPQAAQ